ncbi:DUF4931 domain-containing protein [Candidatus Roizmanbacteria bacterium]|nr:DUF4931 domain-containing protein [Candidatus Roizmanbacteria bacterium]
MARYVPDILSHRWVIISPQRLSRPEDETAGKKPKKCIFCPGNEHLTPPEVFRSGAGEKDKAGWKLRIFPNKYPITDYHEVIVHSPDCDSDIEELPVEHGQLILSAYRERYNFYRKNGQVLIFANHGIHAGASVTHPHSQLVVLPFQINLDTLTREPQNNIAFEEKHFVIYCPDFSQWPYELWIAPKKNGTVFGHITDEEIEVLAHILKRVLRRLKKIYERNQISSLPFGYNYYIYPKENWYLRVIPRFVQRAGFELGTGLSVNIVDPQRAADEFRAQ